ncbi:MAG: hypothetical protein KDG51_14295, partial [Calditrichaeota bacterium]|nr:hypothetical protein [Calditrichota bacterium]
PSAPGKAGKAGGWAAKLAARPASAGIAARFAGALSPAQPAGSKAAIIKAATILQYFITNV